MHVSGFPLDLYWYLQILVTALLIGVGLLQLLKSTASKYFMVDANFDSPEPALPDVNATKMVETAALNGTSCVVCGQLTTKQCAGCKLVKYCSSACQKSHWESGHKKNCNKLKTSSFKAGSMSSPQSCSSTTGAATFAVNGNKDIVKQVKKILFPYEEFLGLFNWTKTGFPPCGLLNCGNSCFANAVLQCLASTRPLVAFLLEKGHQRECRRNDWCFLCEFQTHIERASRSSQPFSPINILSRLPNIGGNLGYGKQEDAHEFLRFAIDRMQSVCLDEFGGEKALHPSSQETTLIQHIFGGHLQSQVICTKCNNVSDQYENMMDLTVEIHGDSASLEECLDQFTAKEWLHGDNMYKCDGCNEYVMAWKRLTIRRAPNILTIALKRFQSGRFGKLNKRITFPETLDLSPYMSESGDGTDLYKLYAVVVHVDMLNASFFGHYICYTKDLSGSWYLIDDSKVSKVDLEEVLSQGAYMLLYSRVCVQPECLRHTEFLGSEEQHEKVVEIEKAISSENSIQEFAQFESIDDVLDMVSSTSSGCRSIENVQENTEMFDSDEPIVDASQIEQNASINLSNSLYEPVSLNGEVKLKPECHDLVSNLTRGVKSIDEIVCGQNGETSCSVPNEDLIISDEVQHGKNFADQPLGNSNRSGKSLLARINETEEKLLGAKLKPLIASGFFGERPRM
ncbi:ubiquitin carboxyl-terminal hydrolase 18 [Impatiens glandulifera]|uniref:ubiquitin carboxyl-terminal hydrolase 18 n=1 Tax=Impatiens glandulifera TaxID=253017 RepID=UPI001FB0CA25|nr:ubiquitin carboxyl-terminal hydrolase 18 [Impatiens glandulifera]